MTYICYLLRLDHYMSAIYVYYVTVKTHSKINKKLFKFNYLTLLARLSRNLTAVCWSVLCIIYITLKKPKRRRKQTLLNQRFFQKGWGGGNDVTVGNNSVLRRLDTETDSQISDIYFQR